MTSNRSAGGKLVVTPQSLRCRWCQARRSRASHIGAESAARLECPLDPSSWPPVATKTQLPRTRSRRACAGFRSCKTARKTEVSGYFLRRYRHCDHLLRDHRRQHPCVVVYRCRTIYRVQPRRLCGHARAVSPAQNIPVAGAVVPCLGSRWKTTRLP